MGKEESKFVNLQNNVVSVYDERGREVSVAPWSRKEKSEGLFVVEGEHYRQFVSARGPLYPFPEDKPLHPPKPEPKQPEPEEPSGDSDEDTEADEGSDETTPPPPPPPKEAKKDTKSKGGKKARKAPAKKRKAAKSKVKKTRS